MARIIPWTLPPVNGGSQGGYTPQPTPTPVLKSYDFTNASFARSQPTAYGVAMAFKTYPSVKASGIITQDITGVAQLAVILKYKWGNPQSAADAKEEIQTYTRNYTAPAIIADPNIELQSDGQVNQGMYVYWISIQILVYNGNGEVMQDSGVIDLGGLNA